MGKGKKPQAAKKGQGAPKQQQQQPQAAKKAQAAPKQQQQQPKAPQAAKKAQEPPQKKAKVEEKAPEKVDDADALQAVFTEVEAIQEEIEKSLKEEGDKVKEIGRQYNTKRQPLFGKRAAAIAKVPNFWLHVIMNSPVGQMLSDKDLEIFKYLKDVIVEEALETDKEKDASDFKITFTFEKNPYFPNKSLWKEFKYNADGEVKVTCGSINWNKGKNPLQKEEKKAPAGKKAGQKRGLEDSEEEEDTSFFAWFSPEAIDEESDSTLGELIRDEIWTNPFTYFHSIDSDEEDDEEGDEDDDEEEEGDE